MDARETKEAGNALIGWFNSQGLSQADSLVVMRKVMAKILSKDMDPRFDREIHKRVNDLTIDLLHDVLDRLRSR